MSDQRKTLIYCRESRDDFSLNYGRIETQRDILIHFCHSRGLDNIVDIIMDDNVSGTDFSRFQPIIERIKKREVEVLVFKDESRLGRNLLKSLEFIEFLNEYHVEILFENEAYNEDFFPLKAWFNEQRAKEDSAKIKRVLRHKMEEGQLVIKAPFGYEKVEKELILHPVESGVVKEIFSLYLAGATLTAIANKLSEEGYQTPSDSKNLPRKTMRWNVQHIRRILDNEVYTGTMIYGKTAKKNYKSTKTIIVPKDQWIKIHHHHQPLVSYDDFLAVQQRRMKQTKSAGKHQFSGFLFCGKCHEKLIAKKNKKGEIIYICGRYHKEGAHEIMGCKRHSLREEDVKAKLIEYLEAILERNGDLPFANRQLEEDLHVKETEKQMEILKNKLIRLYTDKINGIITDEDYQKKFTGVSDTLEKYKKQNHVRAEEEMTSPSYDVTVYIDWNSLDFKKFVTAIHYFLPDEIDEERKAELGLDEELFQCVLKKGGLIFVKSFATAGEGF